MTKLLALFVLIMKRIESLWLFFSFLSFFFFSFSFFFSFFLSFFFYYGIHFDFQFCAINDNFVGLKMQVGYIQIILSDHVSLKIRNTSIKLDFSVTRPG